MNQWINDIVALIVNYSNIGLMPLMLIVFGIGIGLRWIIFFTVKSELTFSVEFEKRVHKYLARESASANATSFHQSAKQILENTFHEIFEMKQKYKRRKFDHITCITDRLFLIQDGVTRLIKDTLSQTQYLKKGGRTPKFTDISKFVFSSNPVFTKVFGIFPMGVFNDFLNILPGLFVVGGIYGTFVGVMQALPALSHLEVSNADATKKVMDTFLLNMAFSMGTSVIGIVYSVTLTLLNAVMSPDSPYLTMVNKFASSLEFLWNDADTNLVGLNDRVANDSDRRALTFTNEMRNSLRHDEDPNRREILIDIEDPLEVDLEILEKPRGSENEPEAA